MLVCVLGLTLLNLCPVVRESRVENRVVLFVHYCNGVFGLRYLFVFLCRGGGCQRHGVRRLQGKGSFGNRTNCCTPFFFSKGEAFICPPLVCAYFLGGPT